MKQLVTFFLFLGIAVQSQNYADVDAKVKRYPKFNSAQKLATKIASDFNSDADKIRATFIWLTENIS